MNCEICTKPAKGVASSVMGPISHPYCQACLESNREVWSTLVAGLFGSSKDYVAEWVKPIIAATCEFYKKTEDQLWAEVVKAEEDYRNCCHYGHD